MRELLFSITKDDFKIDWFSGTGAGGQYRNKHQNCIRLHHKDSGVTVTGQSNRDRISNQKEAMNNLINHPKFKIWHIQKINEVVSGLTLEQKIDEMITPENLKIEVQEDGKWKEVEGETWKDM